MKQHIRWICAALALLASGVAAPAASFHNGQWLMIGWKAYLRMEKTATLRIPEDDRLDATEYKGYIMGVADSKNEQAYLLPAGLTSRQVMETVGHYAERNPEQWEGPAPELVVRALKEAYPLPRKPAAPAEAPAAAPPART